MTFQDHSGQASGREEDDRILIFPFNQNIFSPVKRVVGGFRGQSFVMEDQFTDIYTTSRLHETTKQWQYGMKIRNIYFFYLTYQRSLNQREI